MLEFSEDELGVINAAISGYITTILKVIAKTPKQSEDYSDFLNCKELALAVNQKLETYFEKLGYQYEPLN